MTDTMWRLGRLYADRLDNARVWSGYTKGRMRKLDVDAQGGARVCARFGLEALALRSVLRDMAATRPRPWKRKPVMMHDGLPCVE